jgi:hypothetical protein
MTQDETIENDQNTEVGKKKVSKYTKEALEEMLKESERLSNLEVSDEPEEDPSPEPVPEPVPLIEQEFQISMVIHTTRIDPVLLYRIKNEVERALIELMVNGLVSSWNIGED